MFHPSTGSLPQRSVSSAQRFQFGWWMPSSTASVRIALTTSIVRWRKR